MRALPCGILMISNAIYLSSLGNVQIATSDQARRVFWNVKIKYIKDANIVNRVGGRRSEAAAPPPRAPSQPPSAAPSIHRHPSRRCRHRAPAAAAPPPRAPSEPP